MASPSLFDNILDGGGGIAGDGGIQQRAAWLRYSDVFEPSISAPMIHLGNRLSTGFYGAYLRCCSRVTDIADFMPNEEFQTASSGTYLVGGVVKTVVPERSHNQSSSMSSHAKSHTSHFGTASSRRHSMSSFANNGGEGTASPQSAIGDKHFFPDREKRLTVMSAVAERYIHDIVQFISAMLDDEGAVSAADGNTFQPSSGFGEEDEEFDPSNKNSTTKRNTRRRRHAAISGRLSHSGAKSDTSTTSKKKRLLPVPVEVIPGAGCAFVHGGFFYFLWGTQAGEKLGRSELRMSRKILELQHTTVHVPLTYHLSLKGRSITVLGLCPLSVGNITAASTTAHATTTTSSPSVGILGSKSTAVREASNSEVQAFAQEVISALYMTGYYRNIQVVSGAKSSSASSKKGTGMGSETVQQTASRGAGRECYLPPDVQMHVGGDGRLYCIANAHWMPPWPTSRINRQLPAQRFQNLRVELLVNSCISRVCCRSMHEDALITDNSHFIENTRHAVDNLLQEVVCVLGTPQETKGPETILWRFREMGFNWGMLGLLLQTLLKNISPPMDAVRVVIREMFIRGIKSYIISKVVDQDREQNEDEKSTAAAENDNMHHIDIDGIHTKSSSKLKNGKKKAKKRGSGEDDHLFALNMMGTEAETRSVDAHLLIRMLTAQRHNASTQGPGTTASGATLSSSSTAVGNVTRKASSSAFSKRRKSVSSMGSAGDGSDNNPFGTADVEATLNRTAQMSLHDGKKRKHNNNNNTNSKRARRRAERTEEEQIALEKEESSAMFHSTDGEFRRRRKVAVDGSSMLQGSRTKKKKNQKKEVEMEQLLEDESENRIQHLLAFGDRRPSHRSNLPKKFLIGRRKSSFAPPAQGNNSSSGFGGGGGEGSSSQPSSFVRVPSNLQHKKRNSSSAAAEAGLSAKGSLLNQTARPPTTGGTVANENDDNTEVVGQDAASAKPLKKGKKSTKSLLKSSKSNIYDDGEELGASELQFVDKKPHVPKKKTKLIRVKRKKKGDGAEEDGDPLDNFTRDEGTQIKRKPVVKRTAAATTGRNISPSRGFVTSGGESPNSKVTTPRAINVSFSRNTSSQGKFSSLSSSTFSDDDENGNPSDGAHNRHYTDDDVVDDATGFTASNRNDAESEYVSSKPNFLAHLREVLLAFLNFQGSRMPRPATFTKAAIPPPGDLFGGEVIPFIYKKFRLNADTDAANLYEYMDRETKQEIYDRVCEKLGVEINVEGDVSLVAPVLQHHCVPKSVRPKWIRSRSFTLSNIVFGKTKDSISWSQVGPGLIPLYALLERSIKYHERLIRHAQSGALQDTRRSKKRSFRRSQDNTTSLSTGNPSSGSHSDLKRSRSQVTMEKLRKGSIWVGAGTGSLGGVGDHHSSYSDTSGSLSGTPRGTHNSIAARRESESHIVSPPLATTTTDTTEVPDLVHAESDGSQQQHHNHNISTTSNILLPSLLHQRPSYNIAPGTPGGGGTGASQPHVSFQNLDDLTDKDAALQESLHRQQSGASTGNSGSSGKPAGVTLIIPNTSVLEEEGDDDDDDNHLAVSFRARVLERASKNTNDFFATKSKNSTAISGAMASQSNHPGVGGESPKNASDGPDGTPIKTTATNIITPHHDLQMLKSESIGNASQLLDAMCVGMFPLGLPHLVWHALQLSGSIEGLVQVVEIRRDAIADGSSSSESGEWLIYIQLLRRLAVVEFLSGNITMALTYQGEALEHAESLLSILGNCFSAQMRLYTSELVSYQQHFTMDALVENYHYKLHAGFISQHNISMSTLRAEAMDDQDFLLESHQLLSQQQLLLQTVMIRSISRFCEQDTQIARDYLQLGVALFESGYFKAALEHLGRSHRLFGQILGSTHQLTLISQSNICVVKYSSHCRRLQELVRTLHGVNHGDDEAIGASSTEEPQNPLSSPQLVKHEDLMREKLAMEAALKMLGNIAYHRNANIDLVDCFNDLQGQYVRLKRWINNEVRAVRSITGRSFALRDGGGSSSSPASTGILLVSTTPHSDPLSAAVGGGGGSASIPSHHQKRGQHSSSSPPVTFASIQLPEEEEGGSADVSNSLIDVIDTQTSNRRNHSHNTTTITIAAAGILSSGSNNNINNSSTSEDGIFGGGRFGTCASEGGEDKATVSNHDNNATAPTNNIPDQSDEPLAAIANASSSSQQSKSILIDRPTHNNSISIMQHRSLGVSSSTPPAGGNVGGGAPVPHSLLKGWWDVTGANNNKNGSSISLLSQGAVLATRMRPLAKLLRRLCPSSLEARTRAIHEAVDQSLVPYIFLRPQPPFRDDDE